ncbi:MAG: ferredoxin--NADP reductase [Fibrobacterota bacterium]
MAIENSKNYNATVVARIDYSPSLRTYYIQPDEPFERYKAGQYVTLGLESSVVRSGPIEEEMRPPQEGKMVLRAYSIASAGFETEVLQFYVAHVPSGTLTPRVWSLEPGDRIQLGRRIVGNFTLENAQSKTIVMVGTGTGIAPFLAMVREHAAVRPDLRFVLLHGATRRSELGHHSEFRALAHALPNFVYLPAISRPQLDPLWKGQLGRLTVFFQDQGRLLAEKARVQLDPTKSDVYLCGSPGMVKDISAILEPLGYAKWTSSKPQSLHIEEYWKDKE